MNDDAKISADPDGPEVLVPCSVKLVEIHSWTCRIQLQIECRGFNGFLLIACQAGKAIGKGIGNTKLHNGVFNKLFYSKDLHDLVAKVVDDFYGNSTGFRLIEWAGDVAVER